MIPLYPTQQEPQTQPLIQGGDATQAFYYFLRALFLRTGGASGVPSTVATAVAAGGQTLTEDFNAVATGASNVRLANLQPGQSQGVLNSSGGALTIMPFGSGQIDGGASYSLANGKSQIFTCYQLLGNGSPSYHSLQLG
jgi:hypothetical protein